MQKLTADQLLELRAQALRLANKFYERLIDGTYPTFEERCRVRPIWMRLCARADRRALAFHKIYTQQIATAVEREAFPCGVDSSISCPFTESTVWECPTCDVPNSGEPSRPSAIAPELAQAGQGGTTLADLVRINELNPFPGSALIQGEYSLIGGRHA